MKVVGKYAEVQLTNDPKPMDRAVWQRMKLVVEHEAVHRDWGCALYILHRTGRINNDQREAGDRYAGIARDYKKTVHEPLTDVLGMDFGETSGLAIHKQDRNIGPVSHLIASAWAESLRDQTELEIRRDERAARRYKEAAGVAGPASSILEALLLEDVWPVGEKGQKAVSDALIRLSHFFSTGTKRKR
jgi:hypothetical protein